MHDTSTGLEWFAGPDITRDYDEVIDWVGSFSMDGHGWRMPTRAELKTLYKKGVGTNNIAPLLKTTGSCVWSSERYGSSSAWYFCVSNGKEFYRHRGHSFSGLRGFAVRSR